MHSPLRMSRLAALALLLIPAAMAAQDPTPTPSTPTATPEQPTAPAPAQDQPTGRIVGRVVDAATGQGLADVGVQIVGTRLGVSTGVDGRFFIPGIPAGTVTIQARRIGFA